MHRIGIISDTHGLLRQEVIEILQGCEVILHGGDINCQEILEALGEIAPVYAVRGNNDKAWAKQLPVSLSLELFGVHFFLVHNKKAVPKEIAGIDAVIYGHSHQYTEQYIGRQLWLNPGSCGPRRFHLPVTMALMDIAEKKIVQIEKVELLQLSVTYPQNEQQQMESNVSYEIPPNLKKIIQTVIKDIDCGRSVDEIAARNGIRRELAEQICRLYLTHPGVTADGIMGKMGL